MEFKFDIATKVNYLCDERGITVQKLEQESGIGNGAVGKWDKSIPKVSTLFKVAHYFNVSFDYLLSLTEIKEKDLEQVEVAKQGTEYHLELMISNLIAELNNQRIILNNKPVDANIVKAIQKTLESNLEVWQLMNQCGKND